MTQPPREYTEAEKDALLKNLSFAADIEDAQKELTKAYNKLESVKFMLIERAEYKCNKGGIFKP